MTLTRLLVLVIIVINDFFNLAHIFVLLFEIDDLDDLSQIEVELDRFDNELEDRND